MARLNHDYLAKLLGISVVDGAKIFTKFREYGSLHSYLQKKKDSLDSTQLIRFCYQIVQVVL
jgi:hypothetical protein